MQPQPKTRKNKIQYLHTYGDRERIVGEAVRLWRRLDRVTPDGPRNPEEGFEEEVLSVARRGREYLQIPTARGQSSAQAKWRSMLRPNRYHGGTEENLYKEYTKAVRNYILRYDQRTQYFDGG